MCGKESKIIRFYELGALSASKIHSVLKNLRELHPDIISLRTEKCYYVELLETSENVEKEEEEEDKRTERILRWLLKNPQNIDNLSKKSLLESPDNANDHSLLIEIGPRFNFSTASSTNSVSICHNVSLTDVQRLEVSNRYLIIFKKEHIFDTKFMTDLFDVLGDKMTQCYYDEVNIPVKSFNENLPKINESWYIIDGVFDDNIDNGKRALAKVNQELGLSFDDWDLDYYTNLFSKVIKRNPTNVELFDLAQSNSEHSRHWFFKGLMIINGEKMEHSLIQMIINTQLHTNLNNTIKFSDNSSAIHGFTQPQLKPINFSGPDKMKLEIVNFDLIFTAETHNMPTAVAPFSGATTGTGGRIRDIQGVGRGGHTVAGTAGYCVGNLNIPQYKLPYEKPHPYPKTFACPLKIIIDASDGASDYGNKYGEPVIAGFAISYGVENAMSTTDNQIYDEYVKPIMFSGGLGTMDSKHTNKMKPEKGHLLAKIGGPVYRIGVGGGAASSVEIQGVNQSDLDFNAVQRGDAQMENKMNRVVRACIEMGDKNPILAIHDQGAGGNGNVLKELVEPGYAGAVIFSKEFQLGDPTITALELWGAEYQENNAILCKVEDRELLEAICIRERCPICFVGYVSGNGYVTLLEEHLTIENIHRFCSDKSNNNGGNTRAPFNMHLENVLGDMPRKEYNLSEMEPLLLPLKINYSKLDLNNELMQVLTVMSVGSKRFLTNKVDRCVTGLVAQQQCVGPLHTPISDYAITAISYFGDAGIATSIGTQPIKGLVNNEANAQMSIAEALSNLVFVKISDLKDVKCSGNWMWAAKLPGEGAKLYRTCQEMCKLMNELGIAIDGGKDSLSMAARIDSDTIVKSPGTLVISTYAPCPNVYVKVTSDFKSPAMNKRGALIWINIEGKFRIGASCFAQSFGQLGNDCPRLDNAIILKNAFNITQKLLADDYLLAGHDISDGGLIVCLLEMAFAGLCGFSIDLSDTIFNFNKNHLNSNGLCDPALLTLFSEECGWIIEVDEKHLDTVLNRYTMEKVPAYFIGYSTGYGMDGAKIDVKYESRTVINGKMLTFFKQWERTSMELEKLQMNIDCAIDEYQSLDTRMGPKYYCSFDPELLLNKFESPIRVAVIREEGSNGDREMLSTLFLANFEVHDVTMSDLLQRKTSLDQYRGVVFPGGFSYADVLGSAKGWAASIMFSDLLRPQFLNFKNRTDTFSLGVCNGCQLMGLIGWIGDIEDDTTDVSDNIIDVPNVALLHNKSERYECRWVTLKIESSKSIMLKNMHQSILGCWIAHGEGQFSFKNEQIKQQLQKSNCISMSYVDDMGCPTESYPMNPNGSVNGIAGICSANGRHLAVMPHPERCTKMWAWPYCSPGFNYKKSPWQKMFDEAYTWCIEN